MQKTAISVIIPHYNRPEFLAEALDSVLQQTLPPAEIIVVDDGSKPANRERLAPFGKIARLHFLEKNVGVAEARNIGVRLAAHDWIAFLDDDDLYHPQKLEIQSEYLRSHPQCEIVGGPLRRVAPDGETQIWGYRDARRLVLRDALLHTASSMCTMLLHKRVYQEVGGLDRSLRNLSDLEFGIRLLAAGFRMEIIPEPLVTYRRGGREELSLQWGKTCGAHFRIIHTHRRLYRQEFGAAGAVQEYARRAQFYGLRRGRLTGRSMWAAGCLAELVVGSSWAAAGCHPNATRNPVPNS